MKTQKTRIVLCAALLLAGPSLLMSAGKKPAKEKLDIEEKKSSEWKYDKTSLTTIEGVIIQLHEIKQDNEAVTTYCATVREGAVVYAVHLGPRWYLKSKGFEFEEDQIIKVTGSRLTYKNELAIIAADVFLQGKILKLRDKENGFPLWFEPDQPIDEYQYCIGT